MVRVSPILIYKHIKKDPQLKTSFHLLENDDVVQSFLKMTNVMTVKRLNYNDHGITHSKITSGSALEILDILIERGITSSVVEDKLGSMDDAKQIVLFGAYLHDVGNAIHRSMHHLNGCIIANPILDRLLPKIYSNTKKLITIKDEILHSIFSHDESVQSLTKESGIISVADGTDMAEGRARMPYKAGKVDIHSISALSIKSVEISRGDEGEKPVQINVNMGNPAGVFQIEEVLNKKIATSGIQEFIKVVALQDERRVKGY
ncbi:MAG TPA: HD domain-containing protein [Thermoplasmata archaeon]|nr:HD domain-containing protein [Thermoplasmata archaeon]